MLRALGIVAVLLTVAAWSGCGSDEPATSTASSTTGAPPPESLAPASFATLPAGWHSFDGEPVRLTRRGAASQTFATSWDYQPSAHGPAGDIPDKGAMISVLLLRRAHGGRPAASLCARVPRSRAWPPLGHRPLRIAAMSRGTLEGRPDVTEYRTLASHGHDYRIDVRVDLAPRADRADAAHALAALQLPRWGRHC
jgi:hypothetical protein